MTFQHRFGPAHLPAPSSVGRLPAAGPGWRAARHLAQVLSSPALRQAELKLAKTSHRVIAKRPVRIPEMSLVPIRPLRLAAPLNRVALPSPSSTGTANDNSAKPRAPRRLWREIFFLGVLAVTLVGAYLAGRADGFQKIIVVPGPIGFSSNVT